MSRRLYYPQARATLSLVPFDSTGLSELITIGDIRPISLEYVSNSIKEADTFSVSIPERYFPTDPRLFRAVALAGFMGNVASLDASLVSDDNSLMILGHADDVDKNFDKGKTAVTLKGRDYKGLLLDEKWQGRAVELNRKASEIVREVLDSIPATAPLLIDLEEDGFDPVVPAPRKGRKAKKYRGSTNTPVFQCLLDLLLSVGATITVRGERVVIGKPRTLDERSTQVPYFVTAENLTSLSISRRFGVRDLPNVRITAYDRVSNKTIVGQYPTKPRKTSRATRAKSQTKKTTQTTVHSFAVKLNEPTKDKLNAIAKRVFESYAQQQVTVSFETSDLTVRQHIVSKRRQDEGQEIPVTNIRNGSPVRFLVSSETRNVLQRPISEDQKRRELIALAFDKKVAAVLARGWRDVDTTFFVDTATHTFNADSGYKLSGKASAFMTINAEDLT